MKIPWLYCECGCQGNTAKVGGVQLSQAPRFGRQVLIITGPHEETKYATLDELRTAAESRLHLLLIERREQVAELEKLLGKAGI